MPGTFLSRVFPLFLFLPCSLAGPDNTIFLSSPIASAVPNCAQDCLKTFIAENFPTSICSDRPSINCLCTSNSGNGLTLGEGALQCVASDCSNAQPQQFAEAYLICSAIESAKPETHATITALMSVATTIAFDSNFQTVPAEETSASSVTTTHSSSISQHSSRSSTSSFHSSSSTRSSFTSSSSSHLPSRTKSSISSSTITSFITTTRSSSVLSSPQITSTSTSSTASSLVPPTVFPAAASASPSPTPKPGLTKAQVAGISVAAVSSAVLALGLVLCVYCLRRRKADKRNSGSSFGTDHIIDEFPNPPDNHMMSGANTADGVDLPEVVSTKNAPALSSPTRLDNGRWGSWRRSMKPEEIGLAVAPETTYNITQDNSPISIASYRTTSQLLPDKPTYSLFPPTLRHLPQAAPGDPTSAAGATLAPLSAARRAPTSVNTRQMAPQRQTSNPDPFVYKANDPRAAMYAMERRRATPAQLPRIITPQSQQIPGPWVVSPQSGLPRQIAAPWSANAFPVPVFEEAAGEPKSMSPFASPSDYPGYPSHSPSNPNASSQVNQARYAPTKRKSSGRRPPTHYTTASETSFEDDADEVDDLPRRDLALSPVVESPKKPTPKQVRYPVVPGRAIPDREREFLLESPTRRKPALRKAATDPPSYQSNGKGRALDTSQLAELPGHQANSSRVRPSGQPNSNDAIRGTAKWKILVSPGERN